MPTAVYAGRAALYYTHDAAGRRIHLPKGTPVEVSDEVADRLQNNPDITVTRPDTRAGKRKENKNDGA